MGTLLPACCGPDCMWVRRAGRHCVWLQVVPGEDVARLHDTLASTTDLLERKNRFVHTEESVLSYAQTGCRPYVVPVPDDTPRGNRRRVPWRQLLRHASEDAPYHRPHCYAGCHFSGIAVMDVYHRDRVHGAGRNGLAEEIIRIVVAVVVDPSSTYVVAPSAIVMVSYTALPTGNEAATAHTWRSAAYHPAPVGANLRTILGTGSVAQLVVSTAPIAVVAVIAARIAAVMVAPTAELGTFVLPVASLCIGIHTCQKH